MYKYCNCRDRKGKYDRKRAENGMNPWRSVETDKDDKCVVCGYYAFVINMPIEQFLNIGRQDSNKNLLNVANTDVTIRDYMRSMGAYESPNDFKFKRYKSA